MSPKKLNELSKEWPISDSLYLGMSAAARYNKRKAKIHSPLTDTDFKWLEHTGFEYEQTKDTVEIKL
jgi:hypothetical protein